ncbi:MAG: hypothetical protein KKG75_03450 [Nanoarchaeota archaeon]|nr:hypothetical protein [Nanoarchaeota archaeon]
MNAYPQIEVLDENLVKIHAHICGDGNMHKRLEKRSPSSIRTGRSTKPFNRYILEYTNTCPKLLDVMTKCIKNVYKEVYVCRTENKYRILVRVKAFYDFMIDMGYKDGKNWDIPREIVFNKKFRKIWLRAFFDDEGSVYKGHLMCYNSNKKAMLTIRKMLHLEGFKTSFLTRTIKYKGKSSPSYSIRILACSYLLFEKIGFDHTDKKKKYEEFRKNRMRQLGLSPKMVLNS